MSLAPSSTRAASGLSASAQSSRATPPAVVSPLTAGIEDDRIDALRRKRRLEPRREPLVRRQAEAGGEAVAKGEDPHRRGKGGGGEEEQR